MEASAELTVNKPIQEVWQFITSLDNSSKWVNRLSESILTSSGEFGTGSTFSSVYSFKGQTFQVSYLVTRFEPPYHFGKTLTSRKVPCHESISLEPYDNTTKVRYFMDTSSDTLVNSIMFALFGPLIRVFMRRQLLQEIQTLKTCLEDDEEEHGDD